MQVKALRDPVYGRLTRALEEDRLRTSTIVDIATELSDVADTTGAAKALEWIASLIATMSLYWRSETMMTDSLSVFMYRLVSEVVGRLNIKGTDKEVRSLRETHSSIGIEDQTDAIFQSALQHFCEGVDRVVGVKKYIRNSRGLRGHELREPDYWKNVKRTDELYQLEVRQQVPDLIRPTLRRSAFCAEGTVWLYAFTQKTYAPHSISLISGDIRDILTGLPYAQAEERFQLAVAAAELEFHVGRDGEFWLPTLGTSVSVRALFEAEGATELYEALRAYHAGGLLLIAKRGEITESFYREMFQNPVTISKAYTERNEQFAVIEDRRPASLAGSPPSLTSSSSGGGVVEIEQQVPPFLRRLPGGTKQSKRALKLAREAYQVGKISLADLRKLEEDETMTFVSEFTRYEGALQKTLLHELREGKES